MHDSRPDALRVHLHPKQWVAFLSLATEILFGGAAGPGKSHLLRIAAIVWCSNIPGLQVYLFRRVREDLYKNHLEGPKGFRALLAVWELAGWCKIAGDEIRFWNNSRIYLCHCKDEKDVYKYQGAEIHVLLIDELTHFTEAMYRFLRNRVRMVGIKLPGEYIGRFPRILCAANPGNIGHLFVKDTFITGVDAFAVRQMGKSEGGMLRQFIPAKLEDNPSMVQDDPGYELRLEGLGSPQLVRAMRHGDWDVIEGAFFPEFERRMHVIAPFAVPIHWLRFRSADWGSARPFSIGWWSVVGEDFRCNPAEKGRAFSLPRGAIVRYREWYGARSPNVGLKLPAETVAKGILEREAVSNDEPDQREKIDYSVADPAIFNSDGGKSIAERFSDEKVYWERADNSRVTGRGAMGGWDQMRARLVGTADRNEDGTINWATGRPMLYMFSTCRDLIRTLPAGQHDTRRAEDLDTDGEDHALDDTRYACMSRPWVKPAPHVEPLRGAAEMTMQEAWKLASPKQGSDKRI